MQVGTAGSDRAQVLARARSLTNHNDYEGAFQLYVRALAHNSADGELHYLAGMVAWRALLHAEAGKHLAEAARLAPHHPAPRQSLADWCLVAGDIPAALAHIDAATSIAPGEPEVQATRAAILAASGATEQAWAIVTRLCNERYVPLRVYGLRGRLAPLFGDERTSLNLILSALERPGHLPSDRVPLHFIAARMLETDGQYDRALLQVNLAHAARNRPYNPESTRRQVDRGLSYYTPSRLHDLPRASHGSRRPVFIVGMPRSGTSLVEQILASHPDVFGAGELALIPQIATAVERLRFDPKWDYPRCLDCLSLYACDELAGRYLDEISKLNGSARYVTDKLPTNFQHLGLITLLFPDCHIVHCTRDPLDTCLSCYMTDFALGNEFAQDLGHLGDYYAQYRRLIRHWEERLNVPLIQVSYERLVSDQESATRDLLEALDLSWDERCLAFHRTDRPVATASSLQVRRPIYHDSVGRWRHYERHLEPLREALGPCAEQFEYAAA